MKGKVRTKLIDHSSALVEGNYRANSWDFIYQASSVKHPDYNVGDRVALPDGRVYRYAKCAVALTSQKYTCANKSMLVAENSAGCVQQAGAIGDTKVVLTVTAALLKTPGDTAASGVIAEDALRGGFISLYRGQERAYRGIVGNTALAATGKEITIYLDGALVVAPIAGDRCEILPSPYAAVDQSDSGWTSILGVSASIAAVGDYFWVQTWGICRITPQAAALGDAVNEREFYGKMNGVENLYTAVVTGTCSPQHLGFMVERCAGVSGEAAPFINLQINP